MVCTYVHTHTHKHKRVVYVWHSLVVRQFEEGHAYRCDYLGSEVGIQLSSVVVQLRSEVGQGGETRS